jgi:hypothetical protein
LEQGKGTTKRKIDHRGVNGVENDREDGGSAQVIMNFISKQRGFLWLEQMRNKGK